MSSGVRKLSAGNIALAAMVLLAAGTIVLAPSSGVFTIVFLAAASYVVYAMRRHALSLDRTIRAAALLVTAAGLMLPALVGLLALSRSVMIAVTPPDWKVRAGLALTAVVFVGLVAIARAWPVRYGERTFVLLMAAAAILAKLAYVWAVQAEAVSDFAGMWWEASRIADLGLAAARAELAAYNWPHFERVLPYLLPLRLAFGPGAAAYAIPNVLLGTATSLLTYGLTRRWFGPTAARVALVLSFAAFETVLAAEIPTHEIPGAFYTLLSLLLFATAWELHEQGRLRAALPAGLGFGLAVLVLDVQRSTGSVMILATALIGCAMIAVQGPPVRVGRRRLWSGVLLVLVPLIAFASADAAVRRARLRVPRDLRATSGGIGLAAATDSWGDGTYLHCWDNYTRPYGFGRVSWYRLALVKLASDVHYHPQGRLFLHARKSRILFPLGTQTYFYLSDARLFGAPRPGLMGEMLVISCGFSVLFLAALLFALVRIWSFPCLPLTALAPLFFLATFAAVLLLLAEVQPRYLYPTWYIGPIYIGAVFGRPRRQGGLGADHS